jgi:hypothetical protein
MAASSSDGPSVSSTWMLVTLAAPTAPSSGTASASTVAASPEGDSAAANDLGRTRKMPGVDPVNLVVTLVVATEDRLDADQGAVDLVELDDVGDHRGIELAPTGGRPHRGRRSWCRT